MKKINALIAVLLLAASARAIELSLEENRGERGSVGYVDMERLFTGSPDAQRAKEGFEDLVRQAEERVNLRKAELLKLRQELDATRVERDALSKSMALETAQAAARAAALAAAPPAAPPTAPPVPAPVFAPPPPLGGAPVPSTATAAVPFASAPAVVARSTAIPAASALPFASPPAGVVSSTAAPAPAAVAASTAAAAPAPHQLELALPGMSTMSTAPSAPPAASALSSGTVAASSATAVSRPATVAASSATAIFQPAAVALSTRPAQSASAPVVASTAAASAAAMLSSAPGSQSAVAQAPAGPSPAQRLLEFDAKIIGIQADIAHKESDLMHEHDDADRGLLDVESRKTDQVLARLYRAVSEVARREGVSVVIDKTTILYGHPAVDLTDKVLKYLKETPATPAAQ